MTKTVLISAFSNINAGANGRTFAIYNQINGEKVVLTTDFNHGKKQYYEKEEMLQTGQVCLHVPAYQKNLSIKRIWSHVVFAKHVRKYLKALEVKPHAVYCAMPTSSAAFVCARYCKKNGVKFVIDVIDLWPDSLLPLVKGSAIIKACLFPWTYLTRYAYKAADVIMGESVKYANDAKIFNQKADVYPLYLGVDVDYISKVKAEKKLQLDKPNDEIWIGYAGSLGNSYDFTDLLNAVNAIHGQYKYKLWFIGDGVRRQEIEKYIDENNLNAEITGFLSHEILLGYLSYCDIAVNIFMNNTKVVYSYKFNDYVAMDCFILNSLQGETAEMIDEYKVGRNFDFSNNALISVLSDTMARWDEFSLWKGNSNRLIKEKLDKKNIYSKVSHIFA